MDSTLLMATYRDRIGLALGVDYGQPHGIELQYAAKAAAFYDVPFKTCRIPDLPLVNDVVFAGRNAVLLTLAAAHAQANGFDHVLIGCNFSDAMRFPDCRRPFIRLMDHALTEAYGVKVSAPLLDMTKAQIVAEASARELPPTWTCYAPRNGSPCGECHACKTLEVR
jgi:7-cyano-7-deazaguanine synthase in queuosine biosynthesis